MWLLIIEAFIALGMLVFIVWWTMSSRRKMDEQPLAEAPPAKVSTDPTQLPGPSERSTPTTPPGS